MTLSLLCMIPTRWRRENCERFLKSFAETADRADLIFLGDADDQDTYEGMDWGKARYEVLDFGGRFGNVKKLNHVAMIEADNYDALMYIGDDNVCQTPHWDTILLEKIEEMGGTGMSYGNDKRRIDIPEHVVITSDIVRELGHFAEPSLDFYYIDNVWAQLGGRSGLIWYCPEVIFEHRHYQVDPETEHDQTYSSAEQLWGNSDRIAYQEWSEKIMPLEVARLRRRFNKDLQWLYSKI